ncbi:MAG: sugar transferase [Rhodospirillaceae bacterium]|nr:sugar transferase [Rhodospirillaceae bacterium]MDD9915905.1 sugar transferase [Rhodospirillaceae bacterium]MDD9929464.1 sugar transferase [Rhodospirillaceae bacterium]
MTAASLGDNETGVSQMVIEGKLADYFLDPKRGANRGVGVFALIFCAPLLIAIAFAIRLGTGGPAFMTETRQLSEAGAYKALRFRTAAHGERQSFDTFLHNSRLELLPQLINVVRGDISIASVLD